MKNVARAFVLVLAITGAASIARTSLPSQGNQKAVVAAKATTFPIPTCPPGDPDGCGIAGNPNVVSGN